MLNYIVKNILKFDEQFSDAYNELKKIQSQNGVNAIPVYCLFDSLGSTLSTLRLHAKLNEENTTRVDFGRSLALLFKNKKKKKDSKYIQFYYKNGLLAEPEPIDIFKDMLASEFIVDNCLSIMELVKLQIFSNAYKYMPDHSNL